MSLGLQINSLCVVLPENRPLLQDVCLEVAPGTTHAIMAPNGAGKSSLAYTLMGHPHYVITQGSITFNGVDITTLSPDKRAKLGIFLAFQQPYALPGVTVLNFIKESYQAVKNIHSSVKDFQQLLYAAMDDLGIDHSFAFRAVNDGFSGGEKKRLEMLQLSILKPSLVILDEIDSGLDIDALKYVSQVLARLKQENPAMSILIITHYHRMLDYIKPDFVHIMHRGSVVHSGNSSVADTIEKKGYDEFCTK